MGKRVYDWRAIQAYFEAGHSLAECRHRYGFCRGTWLKAIRRGEIDAGPRAFDDGRRRYDWAEVQAYYDAGHTYGQTQRRFGFSSMTWHKARLRGEIRSRPLGMPIAELLERGVSRYNLKARLLKAGLLKDECSHCGLTHWRGKRLSLHIDHINGVRNDNRLENLRMLCPNCHSQTETYGGLNCRRKRLQERARPL